MRLVDKRHPALAEGAVGNIEVGDAVIDDAGRWGRLSPSLGEHQPNPAALQECEPRRRLEEEAKSQHVSVECYGAVQIGYRDGKLANTSRPFIPGHS